MMAAALAEGTTVIENAAREPEVIDLAALLRRWARASTGRAPRGSRSRASPSWRAPRTAIVPDRIEAGTLLVAGAITGGDVTRDRPRPRPPLGAVLAKLEECGVAPRGRPDVGPRARPRARPRPADITTSPFPGFPTDMQAQLMTLLGLADGLVARHRDDLREPLHARRRAGPHGRADRDRGLDGDHPGRGALSGRAGDGLGSARLGRAGAGRASPRRAAPRSRASTTSIAATSGSRPSWRRWAPASSGAREGAAHARAAQGAPARRRARAPARRSASRASTRTRGG